MIKFGSSDVVAQKYPVDDVAIILYDPISIEVMEVDDITRDNKYYDPTELGYTFIVVQYKKKETLFKRETTTEESVFRAVLLEPYLYAKSIADNGYSGMIIKDYPGAWELYGDVFDGEQNV